VNGFQGLDAPSTLPSKDWTARAPRDWATQTQWTRRRLLAAGASATAGTLVGCVTNPVTGRREFSLVSPAEELAIDQQYAPHQFSADYGPLKDPGVQSYVAEVGQRLALVSHRPTMPYSFRVVRASYVNAYAFPGGSIAVTRGILVHLDNEAQLAALLGHEIGHVCARHAARQMTSALITQVLLASAAVGLEQSRHRRTAAVIAGLGGLGAGLLLARYSREDERQADALGMGYMVRAGYSPTGMVQLMDLLVQQERCTPSALEVMFSTHPMSRERRDTAAERARTFADAENAPLHRERFMDRTASVRAQRPVIEAIQQGDEALGRGDLSAAEGAYRTALRVSPEDYEALLKISLCLLARNRPAEARRWAEQARQSDPDEPMALYVLGRTALALRDGEHALHCFTEYERRLPGNPMTVFYKGRSHELLGRRLEAAQLYRQFLGMVQEGEEADYARRRLIEWNMAAG